MLYDLLISQKYLRDTLVIFNSVSLGSNTHVMSKNTLIIILLYAFVDIYSYPCFLSSLILGSKTRHWQKLNISLYHKQQVLQQPLDNRQMWLSGIALLQLYPKIELWLLYHQSETNTTKWAIGNKTRILDYNSITFLTITFVLLPVLSEKQNQLLE